MTTLHSQAWPRGRPQDQFADEEACRALLETVRWPEGPVCPSCGAVGRATRVSTRPGVWACYVRACNRHFSVTAGAPFHRTRLPLTTWFRAIQLSATSPDLPSDKALADRLGVQFYTALRLRLRIQELLAASEWQLLRQALPTEETSLDRRPGARSSEAHPVAARPACPRRYDHPEPWMARRSA